MNKLRHFSFISKESFSTHKVAAGESLWKISENYYGNGYQWIKIARENNLANPDYLEVNQELKLPQIAKQQKAKEEIKESKPAETVNQVINSDRYRVQKGDSLWKIAVRAYSDGYKWPTIAKANNLVNPNYIEVGQELKLPR